MSKGKNKPHFETKGKATFVPQISQKKSAENPVREADRELVPTDSARANPTNSRLTRQQQWAKGAYERVCAVKGKSNESEYSSRCMELPILIKKCGLVQAIAFLLRKKKENETFVDDIAMVLGATDALELRTRAFNAGLSEYMALTHDAISVAVWFRRFAQSELKDPSQVDDGANHG